MYTGDTEAYREGILNNAEKRDNRASTSIASTCHSLICCGSVNKVPLGVPVNHWKNSVILLLVLWKIMLPSPGVWHYLKIIMIKRN